ncbi:MAG: proline--tRNA ligase [Bacteroidota bacterium]
MRISRSFIPTLKEIPSDATIPSHRLMLRAGLMRQLTGGVYAYLPLMVRSLHRAERIIREEMNAIGGQEFHLPALNPESLWIQTGRRNVPNFILSIKERDLVLAPTHEEVIGWLAALHIQSHKDLPQIWYQIQTKFRNEPRPRSGVLRGRQFTMKDSYTLDRSWSDLDTGYDLHADAYRKIFTRCGLHFFVVGASSGAMGGTGSQEFMVEAEHGEDTVAKCPACDYAANLEIATSGVAPAARVADHGAPERIDTPNVKTIDELAAFLNVSHERLAKSRVYLHDSRPVLVLTMGNDQVNETKLGAALGAGEFRAADLETLQATTGADAGSIGPIGFKGRIIADLRLRDANGLISGANVNDVHLKNIDLRRDVASIEVADVRTVENGEPCATCGTALRVANAIELGHIFKLGTKYSDALNIRYLDETGQSQPVIMGSYGIGVERILACAIEQGHDENGIVWPAALAPFDVHVVAVNMNNKDIVLHANQIYRHLHEAGLEVLLDDRSSVSPGFKFKDADLLGMPVQVIVGEKGLKNNQLEIKVRKTGERIMVALDGVVGHVKELLATL